MAGEVPRVDHLPAAAERVDAWIAALEERHLASLRFAEVTRALRALSSAYVERRDRLARGAALDGAGKRAAFALYYGPIHFELVRRIVEEVQADGNGPDAVLDLGCGTGVAGAAWALTCARQPTVLGIDRNQWAVGEAQWTYRTLGVRGTARQARLSATTWPGRGAGIIAGHVVNELEDGERDALLTAFFGANERGAAVLVVEPMALRSMPWWTGWATAFARRGGRADEWRLRADLPEIVERMARAAGLSYSEIKGRSLWLAAGRK